MPDPSLLEALRLTPDNAYKFLDLGSIEDQLFRFVEYDRLDIVSAMVCGWELVITGSESMSIVSPDGRVRHHFSTRRPKRSKEHAKIIAQVKELGDQMKVQMLLQHEDLPGSLKNQPIDVKIRVDFDQPLRHCGDAEAHDPHRWESWAPWPRVEEVNPFVPDHYNGIFNCTGKAKDLQRDIAASRPKTLPAPTPRRPQEATVKKEKTQERKVVSEQPWMARYSPKKDGGRSYPTRSTIERLWSDGTRDYRCTYPGCDVVRELPHNVVRHFASRHVRHGELKPQDSAYATDKAVVDPTYTESITRAYTPRTDRIKGLAEFLNGLDMTGVTTEDIAEAALRWIHDQSNSGTRMAAEREPLTDTEIVSRIRTLVDNGSAIESRDAIEERDMEIAMLQEDVETLKAQAEDVAALKAQLIAAEDKAARHMEALRAFHELTAEYAKSPIEIEKG